MVTRRRYDIRPSGIDRRDFKLLPPPDYGQMPRKNRLAVSAPIRDQGREGSCWGFAGTRALENALLMRGVTVALSPAFLYWKTREAMNPADESQDTGSDIRTGLDVMLKIGVCREELMPYVAGDFTTPPSAAALADAANYRIQAYHRLNTMADLQYAICEEMPVVVGFAVYQEMEASANGQFGLPATNEQPLGGHAIDCDGYDLDAYNGMGWLVDPNSWGMNHGENGVYFLPVPLVWQPPASGWAEAWAITI